MKQQEKERRLSVLKMEYSEKMTGINRRKDDASAKKADAILMLKEEHLRRKKEKVAAINEILAEMAGLYEGTPKRLELSDRRRALENELHVMKGEYDLAISEVYNQHLKLRIQLDDEARQLSQRLGEETMKVLEEEIKNNN